jgi:hypothetical protein
MLVGYNTNISYKGTVYHVQTEDSGIKNPHIITLLYYKGTILARKKISYANIASAPDYQEKVREIMKEQHKAMLKELITGRHTMDRPAEEEQAAMPVGPATAAAELKSPPLPPPAAEEQPAEPEKGPKKQISKSLDDILLDYILREEGK